MKRKLKLFALKLYRLALISVSIMTLFTGCSKEQFWGVAKISRPGSITQAADAFAAKENNETITPEQARKLMENGIAKVLDSSTYNIKVSGKIDWKKPDQTLEALEYDNKILLDRNEKCFRQDWLVKDTSSKDKPLRGSIAGIKDRLYFDNGSGKWEQGNSQLFTVLFTNLDSVIKHLNSIQLRPDFFNPENLFYEQNQIVIEGPLVMDAENAAASRGLFNVADVELSTLKVESFKGNIKVYIRPKDNLITREEITGSYIIDGEACPVNIKVEIDKINETIELKLPSYVLDTRK